jgi:hypothetical protein
MKSKETVLHSMMRHCQKPSNFEEKKHIERFMFCFLFIFSFFCLFYYSSVTFIVVFLLCVIIRVQEFLQDLFIDHLQSRVLCMKCALINIVTAYQGLPLPV